MPTTYEITAPDGEVYEVTGEGTEQEALAQFQKQWKANGGAAQPQPKGFLEDPAGYMRESGQNTLEAAKHPLQTLDAAGRGLANFVTLGGADRFSAAMDKYYMGDERPYADVLAETQKTSAEKDAAAGSWDDAVNVGAALYNPYSAAQKYAPAPAATTLGKVANVGKRAGVNATEQAGLSGAQSVIQGDSPEDILKSMAAGGTFGAGGSIGADATGSLMNVFRKKGVPQYASEDALQDAAKAASQKLNTKSGRKAGDEVITRNALNDQLRLAETKGPQAFGELSDRLEGAGRDPRFPREVYEGISKLATPSMNPVTRGIANVLDLGGGWGKLWSTKLTGGVAPLISSALKTSADLRGNLDKKTLAAVKTKLLQGSVSGENPYMTPEMKEQLRGYLAKMATSAGRSSQ